MMLKSSKSVLTDSNLTNKTITTTIEITIMTTPYHKGEIQKERTEVKFLSDKKKII